MKKDIILAGVGGQGILSVAAVIGLAAIEENLFVKQAEVHGMSQRGGAVLSHLRISDHEIYSDLIPYGKADMILSVEPMEALRYMPFLFSEGWLITNSVPYINIPDYPDIDNLLREIRALPHSLAIDADAAARELKAPKSSNIIIVGAASPYLDISYNSLEKGIKKIFGKKGKDVIDLNLRALSIGRELALSETVS
ncbi:indolepyruvate oxidoreductase subunit beta [bacterium BMS3Abin04]|nr:indolepyruvate oxidoreductase subunit beta [bacterium BMS3Abin04]